MTERGTAFTIAGPSAHITIEIQSRRPEADYWDGNSCICVVTGKTGAFEFRLGAYVRTNEIEDFLSQVNKLSETLKGEARLSTLEKQVTVRLAIDARGLLRVSGEVVDDHANGSRLTFRFESDQTFLIPLGNELRSVVERYPVRDREQVVRPLTS